MIFPTSRAVARATFVELYTPKLVTILREGYGAAHLRADAVAALTVAIVALPLSMAIALAAGGTPAQGLYTAIVGGFFVSALGGSRFQIGGPAGAFIVLMATTAQIHGMDGLILATVLAGLILVALGLLQVGTYIKYVPYPVTVGFTAGIAVIIFASQIRLFLGLSPGGVEPGPLLEKLPFLWSALPTINASDAALGIGTVALIAGLKRLRPNWPGMLIAIGLAGAATAFLQLPVATIGTAFGGIPRGLPLPALPDLSFAKVQAVFPAAIAIALLGSIESLLSATVADGMTGRRHRSNCELVAQGVANVASGLFGGICVTGTIARTATNVRAGAHGPVAGMLHSAFLLVFLLVAAPLAQFIPLAALAGVLVMVAWNMIEKHAFMVLLRASRADALVLLTTFFLTVFRDLTEAIVVGVALGSVLFIRRMSRATSIETQTPFVAEDRADTMNGTRKPYDEESATSRDYVIYRISGAFFFGAAASIGSVLDRIADRHKALIIDFKAVPFIDSTAAHFIYELAHKTSGRNVALILTGVLPDVKKELIAHEVCPPLVTYEDDITAAIDGVERLLAPENGVSSG